MNTFDEYYNIICTECIDRENSGLIFDDKNKSQQALDLFNLCLSCRCCLRHQQNKPFIWQPYRYINIYNNNNTPVIRCNCNCRHIARMLCNLHPNSHNV